MQYIVTGATGHIGYTLVKELSKLPDSEIKIIVLPDDDTTMFKNMKVHIAYGNILNEDFLLRELTEGSIVFHLAGVIDIRTKRNPNTYNVNYTGTMNLVKACIDNKVKRLIYTSSVHVIPEGDKKEMLYEPSRNDLSVQNVYGYYAKTKSLATQYVMDMVTNGKLDAVIIYPAGVIGPDDWKISEMGQTLIDMSNRKIRARINGSYNFIDVRDVVAGLIEAIEKGKNGEGYIFSGHTVTIDDLFNVINGIHKRKGLPIKLAMWFVKMFARLAEWYYTIKKRKPLFTPVSLYTLTSNHNFSNEKATKELNLSCRPAEESIKDAIAWFMENKTELFKKKIIRKYNQ